MLYTFQQYNTFENILMYPKGCAVVLFVPKCYSKCVETIYLTLDDGVYLLL